MTKTIRIKPNIFHYNIPCKESFFEEHIKNKELPVLSYNGKYYMVEVAGEQYSISKLDVDRCHHTAALEEFNSKDNAVVEALKK